eukprot:1160737-Pelagomonas_calceolata.AAC.7
MIYFVFGALSSSHKVRACATTIAGLPADNQQLHLKVYKILGERKLLKNLQQICASARGVVLPALVLPAAFGRHMPISLELDIQSNWRKVGGEGGSEVSDLQKF